MKSWQKIGIVGLILCLAMMIAAKGTQVYTPFFTVGNKLKTNFLEITGDYINFSKTPGQSGYGFRDSSGVMQFRNSADARWRVMADTVGGTGDEVTIHKDAGTGELSFSATYKGYADTSNALWMGFTSDNPMLYDGMRNQMLFGNRVAIYDSAHYDKAIHYAVNNPTEQFTIVLTDTIMHRGVNDTIPNNVYLISQYRAGIWMNSTDSLYYHGYLEAGRYTVFHNDFYVTTAGTYKNLKVIYPEWFEVPVSFSSNPPERTADLINCFNTAYRFIPSTVVLGEGQFYKMDSLWIGNRVSLESSGGLSYIYCGNNSADTTIWVGGTSPGWDIPYSSGDVTTGFMRNIYIKGNTSGNQRVTIFIKRAALGYALENVQVWSGMRNGCEIYAPNAGPTMLNCWFDSNRGTGIKVWGGGGHFYWHNVFAEGNAADPDSFNYYNVDLTSGNQGYIGCLHCEGAADTVLHIGSGVTGLFLGQFTYGGSARNDSSCVMVDNVTGVTFGLIKAYSIAGLNTAGNRSVFGSRPNSKLNSSPGDYSRGVYTISQNYNGISPVWTTSLGGTNDAEYAPGDTIPQWNGFNAFFSRRNNQSGLGGYYNTNALYPIYYINNNGTVWPLLPAVPLTGADTTEATDYTGDTNTADSLTTTSQALNDLKNKFDKMWRKFKLGEQD